MEKHEVNEYYYFTGFSGKVMPFRPTGKISEDQVKGTNPYVRAKFDDQNRVVFFEKYVQEKLFFRHEYYYAENGKLSRVKIIDTDGSIREEIFEE